ncbi:MAG: peroxiredoxin [Sarcina sp.]
MLEVGVKAPNFNLEDKDGNVVSLDQFKGKKVVLYFYPKDSTPGCTRDSFEDFKGKDVVVIGVSKDSVKSHQRFAQKNDLPFILLADPELEAIEGYDVWKLKKMARREYMGVVRTTYIIDENGMIEKVYDKVKTDKNATEILEYLG